MDITGQRGLPITPYFKTIDTTGESRLSIKTAYHSTVLRIAYGKEELIINIGLSLTT